MAAHCCPCAGKWSPCGIHLAFIAHSIAGIRICHDTSARHSACAADGGLAAPACIAFTSPFHDTTWRNDASGDAWCPDKNSAPWSIRDRSHFLRPREWRAQAPGARRHLLPAAPNIILEAAQLVFLPLILLHFPYAESSSRWWRDYRARRPCRPLRWRVNMIFTIDARAEIITIIILLPMKMRVIIAESTISRWRRECLSATDARRRTRHYSGATPLSKSSSVQPGRPCRLHRSQQSRRFDGESFKASPSPVSALRRASSASL